jgi:hypothetical protein
MNKKKPSDLKKPLVSPTLQGSEPTQGPKSRVRKRKQMEPLEELEGDPQLK